MISQDSIEALKTRVDIVDVIGSYIELRKAGSGYKGLCPFHDEKSPSFSVSAQKQFFHCFGCQSSGDSITFVMEYEKLSYPEAIEKLASEYNFTLRYTEQQNIKKRSNLLDKLQEFYAQELNQRADALEYLKERGVYESSIESFNIGYAPSSHKSIEFLKQQHFSLAEALELGALGRGDDGREYARFIERITFAINAPNGALVGWGGRTISGHAAKYVNSAQNILFNKSKLLYAYDKARATIHKRKEIIITEGYLDVVMLHQALFTQAVATLGTALTPEHLPLLRKGEPRVVMAYDGDSAGKNAALKASKLLSLSGFDGGVVLFEDGVDPADMVKNGKSSELAQMFRDSKPFVKFVIDCIVEQYDLSNPNAKQQALTESQTYLKTLSPLLQEEYKSYLASRLSISSSYIKLKSSSRGKESPQIEHNSQKNPLELSFIKTILEHPSSAAFILDFLTPDMFKTHKTELQKAIDNLHNEPDLIKILIDEDIQTLEDPDRLKDELILFLRRHYEQRRQQVMRDPNIEYRKKSFLNRQILGKIAKLKKGELVTLES